MTQPLTPATRATRARILQGAGDVLGTKGIKDTTVQDILDAAEVSRRTFYQYFSNIDAVLLALYEKRANELVERMDAGLLAADKPLERLYAAIDAYLDHLASGGNLVVVLQAEAARPDTQMSKVRDRALHKMVHMLDRAVYKSLGVHLDVGVYRVLLVGIDGLVVHMQQRHGALTDADRAHVREIVLGMFLSIFQGRDNLPQDPTTEQ